MIPNCPLRKAYDTWCAPAAVAAPLHNYDAPGSKRADSDDSSDSDAGTSRTTAIPRHVTVWLPHPTYFHFLLRPVRCAGLAAAGSTLASSLARPVRASRYHASAARRGFFKQEYIHLHTTCHRKQQILVSAKSSRRFLARRAPQCQNSVILVSTTRRAWLVRHDTGLNECHVCRFVP